MSAPRELGALVRAAATGDQQAWSSLVTRFSPYIRAIARRHRLSASDQDDVAQRTWLALFRHIDGLLAPQALVGWLATTARNESLAVLRASQRELPVDEVPLDVPGAPKGRDDAIDDQIYEATRRTALRSAVRRIEGRERAMLELLIAGPSYAEISAKLKMPVGSIGPTRARSLERLRRDPAIATLLDDSVRPTRPTRPVRSHERDVF
jgi:RNA polymerase sigma factor (sigma-70 family)